MHLVSPRETRGDLLVYLIHHLVGARQYQVVAHDGRPLGEAGKYEVDEAIEAALQAQSVGEAAPALPAVVRRSELLRVARDTMYGEIEP